MPLYHFSEDPSIARFEPRPPLARCDVEPLVWAIDGWHQAMYYFPRDCPRACFWPGEETTAEDRARLYAGVTARMVIGVESVWLERIRAAALYRYAMPEETFELIDEHAGHWVSRGPVVPLSVEPVGDLLVALSTANVELRITPSLAALWREIIQTTMCFSGTRLRNAAGWPEFAAPS